MAYTTADIITKIEKRIDYAEITRVLELDLNTIAQQVITDPQEYLQFQVFFDYGEFDTTISAQAPGEGNGFLTTPVLLSLVNGSYTTEKGPQVYQTEFRIEVLAFEKDRDNVRAVLEVFSSLNQGNVSADIFANALTTSLTDFPVVSEPLQLKGFTRLTFFLSWLLTFIYTGQLSNEVEYAIDDDPVNFLSFNIKRTRDIDVIHPNDSTELTTINKNQSLIFSGSLIYDNSDAAKVLLKNIKDLGADINESFELKITYPTILTDEEPEEDTYTCVLTEGDIQIISGDYLRLSFTLAIT